MGKRQMGEMQPFELVITLVIADLATLSVAETSLPIMHSIIPILVLVCLQFALSILTRKSMLFRKIINGKPIILIGPDGIDYIALKKVNLNFNDLLESLRGCDYFSLDNVMYAILQTNGVLTVLPKWDKEAVTREDLDIVGKQNTLPMIIIQEGSICLENYTIAKINNKIIQSILDKANIKNISNVLIATLDQKGQVYIQEKNKKCLTINIDYDGSKNW